MKGVVSDASLLRVAWQRCGWVAPAWCAPTYMPAGLDGRLCACATLVILRGSMHAVCNAMVSRHQQAMQHKALQCWAVDVAFDL